MTDAGHEDFAIRVFTRRNVVLFLSSLSLVVGFSTGSRAAVGLGEFLLILMVVQWTSGARILPALGVRRSLYPRAFEGDTVTVDIRAENRRGAPAHLLEVTDSFPPSGNFRVRSLAGEVPPRSGVLFRYRQACTHRRGLYVLGPMTLRAWDPLGIFSFRETCDQVSTLLVYPQALDISGQDMLGDGTMANIGEAVVRQIGRGEEFARLRRYERGDPPRYIHWPSTARLRTPHVKEFDRSIVTQITVYCDLHLLALSGLGAATTVEYRIKAAASIAAEAVRHGHLVRVVAVKDPADMTTMGGGHRHLAQILDWMALLKAEGEGSFEEYVMDDARGALRGSTAILVMSSVHVEPARAEETVRLLALRRVRAIAVIVDDRSFVKLRMEQDRAFRAAPALDALVARLRNAGCTVYTVRSRQDIALQMRVPA